MWQIFLAAFVTGFLFIGVAVVDEIKAAEGKPALDSAPAIQINPIGVVKRQGDRARIEIRPELAPALEGLEGFSHVWVLYWFHKNDRPEERAILKVHPRRNPENPLTGVFGTRAPVRPNLTGLSACRIVSLKNNVLEVEGLDALEDSPVLDLKPYLPSIDALPKARTPEWVKKNERW
ncbi:MAG: tRNA (N6-threonylcarbamoyladenosine(37)-N6)-methyltransferase TrmO [Desulfobaccales bacterium]